MAIVPHGSASPKLVDDDPLYRQRQALGGSPELLQSSGESSGELWGAQVGKLGG